MFKSNFNPICAADILAKADKKIIWVWESMIPEGSLFLLNGYSKTGKTELSYHLAIAVARGANFIGRTTKKTVVLVLAIEEYPADATRRVYRLGMSKKDKIYVHYGELKNSPAVLADLKKFISENGVGLVLIDTFHLFFNFENENDNSAVIKEVSPLLHLAHDSATAIGLICHERKSGGTDGRGIRGASSLLGLVDQAICLEKRQGGTSTQRLLKTVGRYLESPKELIIDLVDDHYEAVGNPNEINLRDAIKKILQVLEDEPKTIKEIVAQSRIKDSMARDALNSLTSTNRYILKHGSGKCGSPFTWLKKSPQVRRQIVRKSIKN